MGIYFLNSEFKYEQSLVDKVTAVTNEYLESAVNDLSIAKPFDTTIYPNFKWTEETDGVDGDAFSGGLLQLRIDLRDEIYKISHLLGAPLKATVFHECNHILRWQSVGYGSSLLEATISEGVATSYEKSVCSQYEIKHADYSNISELLKYYLERNKEEDENYDHAGWFFGKGNKYPKWLGYRVGSYVVDQAMKNNPNMSYAELTKVSAEEIIALSNVQI